MKVECPACHEMREVNWKPKKGTTCTSCRNQSKRKNPIGTRTKYKRVCKCGDVAMVGYKPKGDEMCKLCRGRLQAAAMTGKNTKREADKIRYTHFCQLCPSIRVTVDKRKSNLCLDCSRKHARRKKVKIVFDFNSMKMIGRPDKVYHSICPSCDVKREISQANFSLHGANTKCRSCATKSRVKTYRKPKKSEKKVSKAAIEKQREINKNHRESVKAKEAKPNQELSNDDMMAIYLSKKKITVVPDVVDFNSLGYGSKTGFCLAD